MACAQMCESSHSSLPSRRGQGRQCTGGRKGAGHVESRRSLQSHSLKRAEAAALTIGCKRGSNKLPIVPLGSTLEDCPKCQQVFSSLQPMPSLHALSCHFPMDPFLFPAVHVPSVVAGFHYRNIACGLCSIRQVLGWKFVAVLLPEIIINRKIGGSHTWRILGKELDKETEVRPCSSN